LALQGTLDTFSLPDVLRLLATTSKTGRLRIEGDRGRGSVWLAGGGIVDASADRVIDGTPTDEVIFELLRFESGSFAFDGDDVAAGGGDPDEVEAILRRANALLSEWTELEAVVPSLEHEVSLASDLSADEVTIDADRWRSVVAVSAGRTVGELATTLSLTELGVSRAVRDLVDLGVADVDPPGTSGLAAARAVPADLPRRPAVGDPLDAAIARPTVGEPQRAGWLTGETAAVPAEPPRPLPASNGQVRASLDETVVTPPPAPAPTPEPPAKGGLVSRLGLGRSRGADTTGSTPAVNAPTPPVGRAPVAPARTNDNGTVPRVVGPDAGGSVPRTPGVTSRAPSSGSENGRGVAPPASEHGRGVAPPASEHGRGVVPPVSENGRGAVPPSGPARALPTGENGAVPGGRRRGRGDVPTPAPGPAPFDSGRLGPPPAPRDTGRIPPVAPSSLPPDLHWAADDTASGPVSSPFSGISSLGPSRPAPSDPNELAPHVAAMSPEARAAVQGTVGNAGGSSGGRGQSQGEDIAQRGRLISFLASVR
jgi:hypothetical protein